MSISRNTQLGIVRQVHPKLVIKVEYFSKYSSWVFGKILNTQLESLRRTSPTASTIETWKQGHREEDGQQQSYFSDVIWPESRECETDLLHIYFLQMHARTNNNSILFQISSKGLYLLLIMYCLYLSRYTNSILSSK